MQRKWSFPLRISSINVTKSAGNCRFRQIYWRILNEKHHFWCNVIIIGWQLHPSPSSKKYWLLVIKLSKLLVGSYMRWSAIIGIKLLNRNLYCYIKHLIYKLFSFFWQFQVIFLYKFETWSLQILENICQNVSLISSILAK